MEKEVKNEKIALYDSLSNDEDVTLAIKVQKGMTKLAIMEKIEKDIKASEKTKKPVGE